MNHEGPWSWRSTKQPRAEPTHADKAYRERVTANKDRAAHKARRRVKQALAATIRKKNNEPIF
jgi:hypothetical protein